MSYADRILTAAFGFGSSRSEVRRVAAEIDAEIHDVRAAHAGLRAKLTEADATIAQLVEALERAFVALQDYGMPLNCAVGRQIAAALKAAKGEA